jgi:hypothetical protein
MSFVAILFLSLLGALSLAAVTATLIDVSKIAAKAVDLRRARRASRRGWDWPAFEQDLARFMRDRSPAAHRRR